jgi:16S rRNA (cytosine1402-N4)-methyltransferase
MLPEQYHVPVLVEAVMQYLVTRPDGIYIDATLGGGGHARVLAASLSPAARLVGIDRDGDAIHYCRRSCPKQITLIREDFRNIDMAASACGLTSVDGILFDLGVSSAQLDNPQRGFAYQADQELDMRMDDRGTLTAAQVLNSYPVPQLAGIFRSFGELRWAKRLARAVEKQRPLRTSSDLVKVITQAVPTQARNKLFSRVFQAVRIEVNQELAALAEALAKAVELLAQGGRLAVIAYHSLEDRTVKHFFRDQATGCTCPPGAVTCQCGRHPRLQILTRRPVRPQPAELKANPRSRSAKLRVAEKCI